MTCTPLLSLAVLFGPAVAFAQGPGAGDAPAPAAADRVDMTLTFRSLRPDCLTDGGPREEDPEADGFAGRFEAGTAVLFEAVTRNRGPDQLVFTSTLPHADLSISVLGPDGAPAAPTQFGKGKVDRPYGELFGRTTVLKPGQSFMEYRCVLNQFYDLTVEGKYVVSISRTTQVYPRGGGPVVVREIRSGPATILITPPSVPGAGDLDSIEPVQLSEEEWEAVRRMRAAREPVDGAED